MASSIAVSALPETAPPAVVRAPRGVIIAGVVAIVLIGLNLRAGITGAAALLHDLQQVLGYGPLIAAIIPSIPTLCFAVAGAATSWLTRHPGAGKGHPALPCAARGRAAGPRHSVHRHAAGGHRRRDVRAGDLQRGDAVLHPGPFRAPDVADDGAVHGDHDDGRHRGGRADRPRGATARARRPPGSVRSVSWPWAPASDSCRSPCTPTATRPPSKPAGYPPGPCCGPAPACSLRSASPSRPCWPTPC